MAKNDNAVNIRKLNFLIESSKLSKDEVAAVSGISRATLFNALQGKDIKVSTLVVLAKTLGVTAGYLLDESPSVTISPSVEGDCNQNIGNYNANCQEVALLKEKINSLEKLLEEKERLIKVLLAEK